MDGLGFRTLVRVRYVGMMAKKMETPGPFKGICRGYYRVIQV